METASKKTFMLAQLAVIAGCAGLVWLVTTFTLAEQFAAASPDTALQLQSGNASALIRSADRLQRQTVAGPAAAAAKLEIAIKLRAALRIAPLNARAISMLAQLEDPRNDATGRLLRLAERLDFKESPAVITLMLQAYEAGDNDGAARYADILLRTNSQLFDLAILVLARIAERPGGAAVVTKLLAADPPWRQAFFSVLSGVITDARTPLVILQAVKQTSIPPRQSELIPYFQFLANKRFYSLAYYAWLQFLPPASLASMGFLYNGSFETPSSRAPFDWSIVKDGGTTIDFTARPDDSGKRALYLEMGHGRVEFSISQTVLLAPGSYRLQGQYMGQIAGKRGLRWRMNCVDGLAVGESAMISGGPKGWVPFSVDLKVPDGKCAAQTLTLALDARTPSETLVTGTLWFTGLSIQPVRD